MMTVRFPTGLAITYNDARLVYYNDRHWELYTGDKANGGRFIATIQPSAGAVVEVVPPCVVSTAALVGEVNRSRALIERVERELTRINRERARRRRASAKRARG